MTPARVLELLRSVHGKGSKLDTDLVRGRVPRTYGLQVLEAESAAELPGGGLGIPGPQGPAGPVGPQGPAGISLPGGSTGQLLVKASDDDYNYAWATLTAALVACAPIGGLTSVSVQAALGELDANLTAHVGAADPHPQYTTAAELSAYAQPLDADLTAIAALATTSFGRSLLTVADAAAGRASLGALTGTLTAGRVALSGGAATVIDSDNLKFNGTALVLAPDPGGTVNWRSGGSARIGGFLDVGAIAGTTSSFHAFGIGRDSGTGAMLSANIGGLTVTIGGSTAGVSPNAITFSSYNAAGTVQADFLRASTVSATLTLSPSGGSTVIGSTDPGGPELVRTSGAIRSAFSGGYGFIHESGGDASLRVRSSNSVSAAYLRMDNVGAGGRSYDIGVGGSTHPVGGVPNNLYFFDGTASAIRGYLRSDGAWIFGTDPGGSELGRAGGTWRAAGFRSDRTSAASTGMLGEVIQSIGTSVVHGATLTVREVASITLTPGVWAIFGTLTGNGGGSASNITCCLSPTFLTLGGTVGLDRFPMPDIPGIGANSGSPAMFRPVSVASNTSYYLNVYCSHSGAPTWDGSITAIRVG